MSASQPTREQEASVLQSRRTSQSLTTRSIARRTGAQLRTGSTPHRSKLFTSSRAKEETGLSRSSTSRTIGPPSSSVPLKASRVSTGGLFGSTSENVNDAGSLFERPTANRIKPLPSSRSSVPLSRPVIKTASSAANLSGIGVVRVGPPVMAQRTSPPKKPLAGSVLQDRGDPTDPFSLSFKPELVWAPGASPTKRVFGGDAPRPLSPTKGSPSRIAQLATSPKKVKPPSSPVMFGSNSLAQLHFGDSLPVIPSTSAQPTVILPKSPHKSAKKRSLSDDMDVDADPLGGPSRLPLVSSPAMSPWRRTSSKHAVDSDSDEDELDFLSPRKKPRQEGFGESSTPSSSSIPAAPVFVSASRPPSASGIRSPPKKRIPLAPLPLPASTSASDDDRGPRSVPMSRPRYSLPAVRTRYPTPPPDPTPVDDMLQPYAAIEQPHVETETGTSSSTPPPTLEPVILASAPIEKPELMRTATFVIAPSKDKLPQTFYSSTTTAAETISAAAIATLNASHAVPTASTSANVQQRSAIPRYIANPLGPTLSEESVASGSAADASCYDADVSMCSANTSMGGMSQEASKRLANLNAILSRLSVPRPGSSMSLASARVEKPLVTSASTSAPNRRASLASSRPTRAASTVTPAWPQMPDRRRTLTGTNSFRQEYSVPLAAAAEDQVVQDAPTTRHSRRLSMNSRLPTSKSVSRLPSIPQSASAPSASATVSQLRASRRASIVPLGPSTSSNVPPPGETDETSTRPTSNVLKGVVALVDVRTADGDDAGMLFVDMLKQMGARVTTRASIALTHIVYKGGKSITLQRYNAQPNPKPHLVGIAWVVKCAEKGERVDEKPYFIESDKGSAAAPKRRRSMEPRALIALNSSVSLSQIAQQQQPESGAQAHIAASIDRVRRKALQYAPKVGSPLAKRVFTLPLHEEEEDDEEPGDDL